MKGNLDESDRFMMDPVGFISEFAKNWSQPSHIILFNNEEKHLKHFLSSHSFEEVRISPWTLSLLTFDQFSINFTKFGLCLPDKKILSCSFQGGSRSSIISRRVCFEVMALKPQFKVPVSLIWRRPDDSLPHSRITWFPV